MKSYADQYIVKAGAKVKLKHLNSGSHDKFESHKAAEPEIQKHLGKMNSLQYLMYAENERSLLIVLQGMDAAGKDGVIRHVMSGMNPQGCRVIPFKQPSTEELSHDFLWRVHPHAPPKGSVAIFNRSHYEDVLTTRVHKIISKSECTRRFGLINDFENLLVQENKTTVLKFFLHISKKEQLERFGDRLNDPARHWKISEGDYRERKFWNAYTQAFEELLRYTSTKAAPWFIIPSDHKWFRNLAISQIISSTMEGIKMKLPSSTVDIAEIRRKYHVAAASSGDEKR